MSFTTRLTVPLFLFIASMTCDLSFGQMDQAQAQAGNLAYNNGMGYNSNGGSGSAVATSGSWSQGYSGGGAGAGAGNSITRPGYPPADGVFFGNGGSAAEANAYSKSVVNNSGGGLRPQIASSKRNGVWKQVPRPRKLAKTINFSGVFSWSTIFLSVKNVFKSSYYKVFLPDSQKRIVKCSSLFQSSGFSFSSMYEVFFTLYNDISQTYDDMNFFQVGTLALMEMAFGMWKFLKSTPFACMINVVQSFDYVSLMYSFMGRMGCDSLCVTKWMTYASSAFS